MLRFYLINVEETDLDVSKCSDIQFIDEAERQGTVYENINNFVLDFNMEYFSTATHQLRVLTEPNDNQVLGQSTII